MLALGLCAFAPARLGGPRLPAGALPVPIVHQSTDYSCGAATLTALLRYWNIEDEPETDLFADLKIDPKEGSRNAETVAVARAKGLRAEMRERVTLADLERALRRGQTVILDIQAWKGPGGSQDWNQVWEDGHHVVLVGMDADYVYLMDPMLGTSYGYLPKGELLARWHDYQVDAGVIRRFHQLAIFIEGNQAIRRFPGALQPIQ